jgi:hypothetical protein
MDDGCRAKRNAPKCTMAIKLLDSSICTAIAEPTNAATRVHAATGQSSSPGDLLVLLLAPADRHLAKILKFLEKIH